MDLINQIKLPAEVVIDPVTGLALNVPVTLQNYPGWWTNEPDVYEHYLTARLERGIIVDDGIDEWEAQVAIARAEYEQQQ
jgi:hypothetical protein